MSDKLCGAWGGCDLPEGHNMGVADVPDNHHVPAPIDWRALADDAAVIIDEMMLEGAAHSRAEQWFARYREARQR